MGKPLRTATRCFTPSCLSLLRTSIFMAMPPGGLVAPFIGSRSARSNKPHDLYDQQISRLVASVGMPRHWPQPRAACCAVMMLILSPAQVKLSMPLQLACTRQPIHLGDRIHTPHHCACLGLPRYLQLPATEDSEDWCQNFEDRR